MNMQQAGREPLFLCFQFQRHFQEVLSDTLNIENTVLNRHTSTRIKL